jgi:polyhydroxybutyrate depolymerase
MGARTPLVGALLIAALGVVLAFTLSGLGGAASRPVGPAPDATKACAVSAGTTQRVSVAVAGQPVRSALVHLPPRRDGHMALIVALHGAYGNGAFMERYSGLSKLGDREGFAVVYPDAAGPRWRIGAGEGEADVQFIDALLDRVLSGGCFDGQRVAAVGVSNGAGMAARFACAGDDRLAGLVAVAGDYGPLPTCQARRPLSVLEIHGTADAAAPYHGTAQDPGGDVLAWVTTWVERDACRAVPRRTRPSARVLRLDWTGCRDDTAVEHLQLVGGAHAWPGGDPPDAGPQFAVSASGEAWSFLRDRRLSPAAAERHHR